MRTTIDKAGRVVIPAADPGACRIHSRLRVEITEDELGVRLERVAAGPRLVKIGRRLVARPTVPLEIGRSSTSRPWSKKNEIAGRERLSRHQRAPCRSRGLRSPECAGAIADSRGRGKGGGGARHRVALLSRVLFRRNAPAAGVQSRAGGCAACCSKRKCLAGWRCTTCRRPTESRCLPLRLTIRLPAVAYMTRTSPKSHARRTRRS